MPDVAGAALDRGVAGRRPRRVMSALPVLTAEVAAGGDDDADVQLGVAAEEAAAVRGAMTVIWSPSWLDVDLVGVAALDDDGGLGGVGAGDVDGALADLDVEVDGLVGLEAVLGHGVSPGEGVSVRVCCPRGRRSPVPEAGGWVVPAGQTQPVMRRSPRLPVAEGVLELVAEHRDARQVDVDVDGVVAGRGADDVDQPGVERVAGPGRELLGRAP